MASSTCSSIRKSLVNLFEACNCLKDSSKKDEDKEDCKGREEDKVAEKMEMIKLTDTRAAAAASPQVDPEVWHSIEFPPLSPATRAKQAANRRSRRRSERRICSASDSSSSAEAEAEAEKLVVAESSV